MSDPQCSMERHPERKFLDVLSHFGHTVINMYAGEVIKDALILAQFCRGGLNGRRRRLALDSLSSGISTTHLMDRLQQLAEQDRIRRHGASEETDPMTPRRVQAAPVASSPMTGMRIPMAPIKRTNA